MKITINPQKPKIVAGQIWKRHGDLYLFINKINQEGKPELAVINLSSNFFVYLKPEDITVQGEYMGHLEVSL